MLVKLQPYRRPSSLQDVCMKSATESLACSSPSGSSLLSGHVDCPVGGAVADSLGRA